MIFGHCFCDSLVVVVVEEVRRVRAAEAAGLGLPAGPDVGLDVRVAPYDCGRAGRGIGGEGRGRAEREREDGLGHGCGVPARRWRERRHGCSFWDGRRCERWSSAAYRLQPLGRASLCLLCAAKSRASSLRNLCLHSFARMRLLNQVVLALGGT